MPTHTVFDKMASNQRTQLVNFLFTPYFADDLGGVRPISPHGQYSDTILNPMNNTFNWAAIRRLSTLSILILSFASIKAQGVSLSVVKDDPKDVIDLVVMLDPLQMDAPVENSFGLAFNTGLYATGFVKERIGFDFSAYYGTLTMGKLTSSEAKTAYRFEGGGMMVLSDNVTKRENTKVLLDEQEKTTVSGRVETVTYVRMPAQKRSIWVARGGLYARRNPFDGMVKDQPLEVEGNISTAGIYLGLGQISLFNIFADAEGYGRVYRSGASRLYADLMVAPMVRVSNSAGNFKSGGSPVGLRIGYSGMPVEDKTWRKRKIIGAGVEVGYRPGDGLYAMGGIYIPMLRKRF